jgi:hypothetical protein
MGRGVLLIVNCALDSSYRNRHVLQAIYGNRFDELVFTVSETCPTDPLFATVAQADPSPAGPPCICCNDELGPHGALRHSFHWRLLAAEAIAAEFDHVVFAEDDCLISPQWDADRVRRLGAVWDAWAPPIRPCSRDQSDWVWSRHAAGYPAFDAVAHGLDHVRLAAHGAQYGDGHRPGMAPVMFYGFSDFLVAAGRIWRGLMRDLKLLRTVWHEAAIPTALLHQTPRVGVSNGLALWGSDRDRSLVELIGLLGKHDFVHAVKLSQYDESDILAVWKSLGV